MLTQAGNNDIQLIESLGRETYRQHFAHIWSESGLVTYLESHFSKAALIAQLKTPYLRYYIPYVNDVAAGIFKVKISSQIPAAPFDRGLELEKIYLLQQFTGRGIGRIIIQESEELARNEDQRFLWLDVLKSNARAKKLYESMGFSTVGEIVFSTDIQKIDMWIMRKDVA
jgi:ribosomal protein S18 acetylase RimI-like enzyme